MVLRLSLAFWSVPPNVVGSLSPPRWAVIVRGHPWHIPGFSGGYRSWGGKGRYCLLLEIIVRSNQPPVSFMIVLFWAMYAS